MLGCFCSIRVISWLWFDQDIWKIWSHSSRGTTALSAGVQQESSAEEGRVCSQSCTLLLLFLAPFDPQTKEQLLSLSGGSNALLDPCLLWSLKNGPWQGAQGGSCHVCKPGHTHVLSTLRTAQCGGSC